jgi:predicted transcriptional regulator
LAVAVGRFSAYLNTKNETLNTNKMDEIINKVANSALEVFDLEDFYPSGIRTQIDISQWLLEGLLLKEKDFREALKKYDWQQYENHFVAIHCSTEAIIPAWATILVTTYLSPFVKKVVLGSLNDLETSLYQEILSKIDYTKYQYKPVILKGCSKKSVPESAYIFAIQELQKVAKSVMYGEACSAVPLYKKGK